MVTYLHADEKRELVEAAKAADLSMAQFIRSAIRLKARAVADAERRLPRYPEDA